MIQTMYYRWTGPAGGPGETETEEKTMKVLHMFAATALLAATAMPAFADTFDTVFCGMQSNADAIKTAVMSEPSLEFGANNEAALAVMNPLLANGKCTTREFVDLPTGDADFSTHADGVRIAVIAIDNGYAVVVDFPDI